MHDVQGVDEIMPDSDYSLINGVDEFAKVLLLSSHFDINIDFLENRKQILVPKEPAHLT